MDFITYNTDEYTNYVSSSSIVLLYNENFEELLHGYSYLEMCDSKSNLNESTREELRQKVGAVNISYRFDIATLNRNERRYESKKSLSNVEEGNNKGRTRIYAPEKWVGPHIRCYDFNKDRLGWAFITHTEIVGTDYVYRVSGEDFEIELPGNSQVMVAKDKWIKISDFNNNSVIFDTITAPNYNSFTPKRANIKKITDRVDTLYSFQICASMDFHPIIEPGIIIRHPVKKGRNF